ncbi:MAG: hypothetical protein R3C26_06995 [Calditrichia bacterium]
MCCRTRSSTAGDTLSFAIGDLLPSASETVTVNPTVVSDLPFAPFPLVNTIIATGDNADPLSQTFYRHGFRDRKPFVPTTTLDVSWKVQTDSFTVQWNRHDLVRRRRRNLFLSNYRSEYGRTDRNERIAAGCAAGLGHQRGRYAELRDWRSVAIGEFDDFGQPDSGERPALHAFPLVNTIIATGDNADPLSQTFSDTVFAIEKPFVPTTTTLDISWKVQTDSFTVSGTDTTWFAEEDETYSYNIPFGTPER